MTAACMAKVLGTRSQSITLIESSEIPTVGVGEATIPMIDVFHRIVGLNPMDLVNETEATFKLGIEFQDWKKLGHKYFHAFGFMGNDLNGISFLHYWLRQRKLGKVDSLAPYNLETRAAYQNKFSFQPPRKAGEPPMNYAYHFDAGLYAQMLRRLAVSQGVNLIDAKMTGVERNSETGDVKSLILESGYRVDGDLFIDCSGMRALLIGKELGVKYIDWKEYLPCTKAIVVGSEALDPIPPYTRATAKKAGWQWRVPLQHRTGNGHVFADDYMSADEATQILLDGLDTPAIGEPREISFTTGLRERMWEKNVISIGLSSGFMEPLESTSIFLVQSALSKLMIMFPRGYINDSVRTRFNDTMTLEMQRIRDFLVAHYTITERDDTPFWRHCKSMKKPDSLVDYLSYYEEEGMFIERANDLFQEGSWFAVLDGQGLSPKRYHPIADNPTEDSLDRQLAQLKAVVDNRLMGLPSHEKFVNSCRDPRHSVAYRPRPSGGE